MEQSFADFTDDLVPSPIAAQIYHRTNDPICCMSIIPSFGVNCDSASEYPDDDSMIEYAPSDCTIGAMDSDCSGYTDDDQPGLEEGFLTLTDFGNDSVGNPPPADPFRLESWIGNIADHTFPTRVVDLCYHEAKAIAKYFEAYRHTMQLKIWEIQNGQSEHLSYAQLRHVVDASVTERLSEGHIQRIHELELRLNGALYDLLPSGGRVFVRLGTRSPKDSAITSLQMRELLREGIASHIQCCPGASAIENVIEDLNIFTIASCAALQVASATDAIDLLIHSSRVFHDIMRCELDTQEGNLTEQWDMQVVVREWWPCVFPPFTFRCFVYDDIMTAITQYYSLAYYPELEQHKSHIQNTIVQKWEVVHGLLGLHTYSIDFAMSRELDAIVVVEINPPPPIAGTNLFDFSDPDDNSQIERGRCTNPSSGERSGCETGLHPPPPVLEFRLQSNPAESVSQISLCEDPSKLLDTIDPVLRAYIDELRSRKRIVSSKNMPPSESFCNKEGKSRRCIIM